MSARAALPAADRRLVELEARAGTALPPARRGFATGARDRRCWNRPDAETLLAVQRQQLQHRRGK